MALFDTIILINLYSNESQIYFTLRNMFSFT